jgi:hypothetical protein
MQKTKRDNFAVSCTQQSVPVTAKRDCCRFLQKSSNTYPATASASKAAFMPRMVYEKQANFRFTKYHQLCIQLIHCDGTA